MESRTQGSRPRTQKRSNAKDRLTEDRGSRDQRQECSRPRTKVTTCKTVVSKKKGLRENRKISAKFLTKKKKGWPIFNKSKNSAVLDRGQGIFEDLKQRWSRGHKARGQTRPGTQKIRGLGQGQPFRGQTLSTLRTGMLEANDQGHRRKCSPKKKKKKTVFKINFQATSKKKKERKRYSSKFFRRSAKF